MAAGNVQDVTMRDTFSSSKKEDGHGPLLSEEKDGKLLRQIAQTFSNMEHVIGLAVTLLDGVGEGGAAYVESLTAPGGVPVPTRVAHEVLRYWCANKQDNCYGDELYAALKDALPKTAKKFQSDLVDGSLL